MAAHKHAELMKQWAENIDLKVEYRDPNYGDWIATTAPAWDATFEYRIKPAKPVVEYPVTRMTRKELLNSWSTAPGRQDIGAILYSVANDVLRHALDAQQVVRMAEVQEIASQLGKDKRAARDMAVAEAVKSSLKIVSVEHGIEMGFPDLATVIAGVK